MGTMYVPDNQSQEKIDVLRTLGADVVVVPTVSFQNPNHFYHQAKRRAQENENTYFPDQVPLHKQEDISLSSL